MLNPPFLVAVAVLKQADGTSHIGLIAEEVGKVVPEVVDYEENEVDERSVTYSRIVALLIEAIKEQQQAIELLRAKVDHLGS